MDAFSTPKRDGPEFEVTGVSRSGRVRKKSSKLMDFESSSNIIESKIKRPKLQLKKTDTQVKSPVSQVTHSIHVAQIHHPPPSKVNSIGPPKKILKSPSVTEQNKKKTEPSSDYETQSQSTASESDDDEISRRLHIAEFNKRNLSLDTLELAEDEILPAKKKSSTLKKPKKIISPKQDPKPKTQAMVPIKPKTRYTAYMLWCKEIRKDLLKKDPTMEFSAISKKLGELWATVPSLEKHNWSNRAKRLAEKNQMTSPKMFSAKSPIQLPSSSSPKKSTIVPFKKVQSHSIQNKEDAIRDPTKEIKIFRAIELQPIDVAAYLRLLGESLTVIGERLKEHNGQITVSGSLSVLLDSLLCALSSLICLTQQIPAIGTQNTTSLSQTLDNIAYIMPGL